MAATTARAFTTLLMLALAAAPHGIAAPAAPLILYTEDFENGMAAWSAPQYVGTTEGCLGAASGSHSLQIADCGKWVPAITSLVGSGWIMETRVPAGWDQAIDVTFAVRGTSLYLGRAHVSIIATCFRTDHLLGEWTVGGTPLAELGIVPSSAPTEWTTYERSFPCHGPEMRLRLTTEFDTGSPPVQELFALDAIVVRAS